ncbi:hypothetical protein DRO51_02825 [Candidatus Bathyarchaeota archaeon]|nr:MAG: hypothetical protein DRO51_02825 [Candidatus Bathyarchaeota archaeon]
MSNTYNGEGLVCVPIVLHFHQPVGQIEKALENAYKKSYLPLTKMVLNHEKVKVSLHYSGYLLDWFKSKHPEYFEVVKKLIDEGRVEILTGAYYEPILPAIPDEDKIEQIKMHKEKVWEIFGVKSQGFWLPERVWEPHLPKILGKVGIKYVIVDDRHALSAGLTEEEAWNVYVTEEENYSLAVFFSNEKIEHLIPWSSPEETLKHLSKVYAPGIVRCVCILSDAEKFGEWFFGEKATYDVCYLEGWLDRWFFLLEDKKWISLLTPSEYLKNFGVSGLIYLPTESYTRMSIWALPTKTRIEFNLLEDWCKTLDEEISKRVLRFLRGGFWRNYLAKYPESNNMHKKMLYVRSKILQAKRNGMPKDELKNAWVELYKGQCNDVYWYGLFGGIYMAFLRHNIYRHLLTAESLAERYVKVSDKDLSLNILDFDGDWKPEIILENRYLNVYIKPSDGGSIFELDYKPSKINLLDVMSRRREPCHYDVEKLGYKVYTDNCSRRSAFRDYLLNSDIDFNAYKSNDYTPLNNSYNGCYNYHIPLKNKNTIKVSLTYSDKLHPTYITKTIQVSRKPDVKVDYELTNLSLEESEFIFASEFPFTLVGHPSKQQIKLFTKDNNVLNFPLRGDIVHENVWMIKAYNEQTKLSFFLSWNKPSLIWIYDVEMVLTIGGKPHIEYQGTSLTILHKVKLNSKEPFKVSYKLSLKSMGEPEWDKYYEE